MRDMATVLMYLCACGSVKADPDASASADADLNAPDADPSAPDANVTAPDANVTAPDANTTPDAGVAAGLRVFITNAIYKPSEVNGLSGADTICQGEANVAVLGGVWMAWLANNSVGPASHFSTMSTGPYVRLDNVRIADNWTDLIDGTIQANIDLTPGGPVTDGNNVWSNVTTTGTALGTNNCGKWTDDLEPSGHYGRGNFQTSMWTDSGGFLACGNYKLHLYCFEQ